MFFTLSKQALLLEKEKLLAMGNFSIYHNIYTPTKQMFSGVYLNHPVCPSVCRSVQNTSFCQSAVGVLSHILPNLIAQSDLRTGGR